MQGKLHLYSHLSRDWRLENHVHCLFVKESCICAIISVANGELGIMNTAELTQRDSFRDAQALFLKEASNCPIFFDTLLAIAQCGLFAICFWQKKFGSFCAHVISLNLIGKVIVPTLTMMT